MRVLVVGSGGREHAVIKKLAESPRNPILYCAPGNGGIAEDAVCVPVQAVDLEGMISFIKSEEIDFVVVTPDDPLALGMADRVREIGVAAFGPSMAAARIESSKVFSKNLMKKYRIPTAGYEVFDDIGAAKAYIRDARRYPVVIKADGLALGKGVVIAEDEDAAMAALGAMMEERVFGSAGGRVVVEEFMTGPEVTVLAFCDGETLKPMVSSMDHKRALDQNQGLNTGGMGTIAPNPHYTPEMARRCMEEIFLPTVLAMKAEGCPFQGCLYFGLMLTPDGPKVIEYNCRFGDPEAQVVLPLLQTDLLDVMEAVNAGRLAEIDVEWHEGTAACVVMASGGYPEAYEKGHLITGLERVKDATVYHAGTKRTPEGIVTAGGRVLGVSARGTTLREALRRCYAGVAEIHFQDAHHRTDIGKW